MSNYQLVTILLVALAIMFLAYRLFRYNKELNSLNSYLKQIVRDEPIMSIDTKLFKDKKLKQTIETLNKYTNKVKLSIAESEKIAKVRSEFLGNVSHELRTPIFTIQGFLETVLDNEKLDNKTRYSFLEKTHRNVLRLHNLLNDLIEISRIESKEMKMNFRSFNPSMVFNEVITDLKPTAEQANIKLLFNNQLDAKKNILVLGDIERIKQVIANLIENAIKYNTPNGTVTLSLKEFDKYILVAVADTGIGISTEETDRIFERFYRVNKDRSRQVGGTGLGLAIVKHIVEAHKSSIQVSSELGVGSEFSFTLEKFV